MNEEIDRRRTARIKAALPIKEELLKLGAQETNNELIVCFSTPKYVKPRGNIWTYKGKVYIRWSNLGPKDVPRIKKILGLQKIPAKNPLRRKAVVGLVRDQFTIDEFNKTISQQ